MIEAILALIGFALGFSVGRKRWRTNLDEKLRKRGYLVRSVVYHGQWGYDWLYNGFDKDSNMVYVEGPWFEHKVDAIANAEAHYLSTIMNKPLDTIQ